ncbi:MAG TPA: rod shape-determining protein RodA [Terriglobia bacterium]|nr:rod shape-determining protein RodA [Terriglobia bacterium]
MRKAFTFRDPDWILFGLFLAIAAIGVIEIYSTTAHTALAMQYKKQIYWILIGALLALVVSRIDYHVILEQTPWLYIGSLIALAGLLVFGRSVAGTKRWLHFGGILTFQVSEMVKLVIIFMVAAYFAERRTKYITWGDLVKLGILCGLPAALVAMEPDLGTALTYVPIVAAGVFVAGIRTRQVLTIVMLGFLALPVGWHFLRPYQRERILTFVHPSQDTQGSSYQVTQTKIAIGSGGFWGKGLGNGTQSRLGFIPVSHADAIFASYAEEQGFVGTLFALLLYFALLLRLLEGAQMAGDRAGAFLLVGFAAILFFQIAVNTGMMIGLLPITGIPLPLMSQGGSSVLFTFVGLGVAMSVRMRRFVN